MGTISQTKLKVHQDTPAKRLGGDYRREAGKIWKELAQSEARVNLIRILVRDGMGLSELEEFEVGLANKFKSTKFKSQAQKPVTKHKVVTPVMKLKLADEQCYLREMKSIQDKYRKEIARILGKNTNKYKKTIAELRQEAKKTKEEATDKYKKKADHIRRKYKNSNKKNSEEEREYQEVPEDLVEYSEANIFDKKIYENIVPDSYSYWRHKADR